LQPDGKALYATVLAAEMAGKQISISVGGERKTVDAEGSVK